MEKQSDYFLPASIIIAALLISGSWIYTSGLENTQTGGSPTVARPGPNAADGISIKPVSADDHILGNPEAPVKIVEFSDLECPFCKSFHPTMKRVIGEYGQDGRVAWVYRHFPLDQIHPKARKEAEASECAAELGGNDKFWDYIDEVFNITPSNNNLDLLELPKIAEGIGLDRAKFQFCLDSGKYANRVASDIKDAENSGARGTPYSVVIGKAGKKYPVGGALPYEQVKLVIEEALK